MTYLHKRGLKVGIYTDAGEYDGGKWCGLGSRGHYEQDARQFAGWKVDAIKVDFLCGIGAGLDPGPAFKEFSDAVAKSGRKMLLNLCNPLTDDWGMPHTPEQDAHNTFVYGPTAADSWRTGTDIAWGTPTAGEWPNILRNMDANAWHPEAQGPGHWNDPDYLIPMRKLAEGGYELTEEESTTQFVMWAEMASPLMLGSDPRTLAQSMIDTLRNPEIIAVDQDPLGIQGARVATDSVGDVYSKVLQGAGKRAVVLLNRSDQAQDRTVTFADAGLAGKVAVRDLRARASRGTFTGSYTVRVPAHGTAFLKLTGTDEAPGTQLPGRSSASPALVRDGDTLTVFTRGTDGALRAQTAHGGDWATSRTTDLGGPTRGRILGQPAAYASAGGRIDVFVRGADDTAYRRVYANGHWGRWQNLGGTLTDAPTAAFAGPDDWTLFARGADGHVWSRGSASAWTSLGAPQGRPFYGRPSAVVDDAGRLHVAVRTPTTRCGRVPATPPAPGRTGRPSAARPVAARRWWPPAAPSTCTRGPGTTRSGRAVGPPTAAGRLEQGHRLRQRCLRRRARCRSRAGGRRTGRLPRGGRPRPPDRALSSARSLWWASGPCFGPEAHPPRNKLVINLDGVRTPATGCSCCRQGRAVRGPQLRSVGT